MNDEDKTKFTKPPGFYWLKKGDDWTIVEVRRVYHQSEYIRSQWLTMVSALGSGTQHDIYYYAERAWGPKIEEYRP